MYIHFEREGIYDLKHVFFAKILRLKSNIHMCRHTLKYGLIYGFRNISLNFKHQTSNYNNIILIIKIFQKSDYLYLNLSIVNVSRILQDSESQ